MSRPAAAPPPAERPVIERPPRPAADRHEPVAPPRPDRPAAGATGTIDVNEIWQRLLTAIEDRPAMSWVGRSLRLRTIQGNIAHLAQHESARFITDGQQQQLEQLLTAVVGRPIRVNFVAAGDMAIHDDTGQTAPQAPGSSPAAAAARSPRLGGADRDTALRLPLVKQVFDVFGQATLLGVRPDQPRPSPPPVGSSSQPDHESALSSLNDPDDLSQDDMPHGENDDV